MSESETKPTGATRVCPWWMCYTFDNPLRRLVHQPRKLLGPYLRPGMTAMDVGCGMGYFSLGMARLVGESGRVIAVDLQQRMLDVLTKRAARAGVLSRIRTCRCSPDDIGVNEPVDFILSFWMAHEVADIPGLLEQLRAGLQPGGKCLIVEPRWHVRVPRFQSIIAAAEKAGFRLLAKPRVRFSRAALFE